MKLTKQDERFLEATASIARERISNGSKFTRELLEDCMREALARQETLADRIRNNSDALNLIARRIFESVNG